MTTENASIDQATASLARRVGPATAALVRDAFKTSAFINHPTMAELCGLSDKQLKLLGDQGRVKFGRKGTSHRIYTEKELIRLIEAPDDLHLCHYTNTRIHHTGSTTSNGKALGFTARRAKHQNAGRTKS